MTEPHEDAVAKAYALLSEHFDGVLIATTRQDGDKDEHSVEWSGGWTCAMGLAQFALDELRESDRLHNLEP